jgi:hypothetical protein
MMQRKTAFFMLTVVALALSGCAEIGPGGAEAKIGVGPFKAVSVEAGPGGIEQKGPSAGPFGLGR